MLPSPHVPCALTPPQSPATSPLTDGLTQTEAKKRLTQNGPNEIAEKKTNELLKFLSYF